MTKYTCDRCGHETFEANDKRDTEAGSLKVSWEGSISSCGYDGAWGGAGIDKKAWLCFDCTKEFNDFMRRQ